MSKNFFISFLCTPRSSGWRTLENRFGTKIYKRNFYNSVLLYKSYRLTKVNRFPNIFIHLKFLENKILDVTYF